MGGGLDGPGIGALSGLADYKKHWDIFLSWSSLQQEESGLKGKEELLGTIGYPSGSSEDKGRGIRERAWAAFSGPTSLWNSVIGHHERPKLMVPVS